MDLEEDPDTNRTTAVPLKELSDDVRRDIQDRLTIYLVALCYTSDSTNEPRLCGSGTLVYANDIYGILTAGHVVETLRQKKSIGIAGIPRGTVTIQGEHVLWYETGGPYTEDGVDLGFIELQPTDVAAIKPL